MYKSPSYLAQIIANVRILKNTKEKEAFGRKKN